MPRKLFVEVTEEEYEQLKEGFITKSLLDYTAEELAKALALKSDKKSSSTDPITGRKLTYCKFKIGTLILEEDFI